MTKSPDFSADCARCAGLCCVAFAFDRSTEFAHDKAADEPCHNLDAGFGCTIHSKLDLVGYPGCVRFDCHGAGQRVVQDLFGGTDWRAEPGIFSEMMAVFRVMRRLHALLEMLHTADSLDLDEQTERLRLSLIEKLDPTPAWTRKTITGFDIDSADAQVSGFLRSLALRFGAR